MPLAAGPVKLVPYGVLALTHYSQDLTGEARGRFYGGGGVRGSLPLSRLYPDVQSELFNVHGVFHKASPELTVQTNEFEGFPGIPALEWMTLEERDGRTYLTAVSLASSVEVRDMVVATGMESGARSVIP